MLDEDSRPVNYTDIKACCDICLVSKLSDLPLELLDTVLMRIGNIGVSECVVS